MDLRSSLRNFPFFRALRQTVDEVTIRAAGQRFLSSPLPIQPYAQMHLDAAWLAESAYGKTIAGRWARRGSVASHIDPQAVLQRAGWTRWDDFPDLDLHRAIKRWHLRVEVWEKQTPPTVAVAFGGTVFSNKMDWRANLRWFTPLKTDEYSAVVRLFAPQFIRQYAARHGDKAQASRPELWSVGHSLGGGLAQQFAYCLPANSSVPRVSSVYAFDPSPVTGYFSVDLSTRRSNKQALAVNRIYERGEILAIARSIMSVLWQPSARHPTIRGYRYYLFRSRNSIADHSMNRMATKLSEAARSLKT